MLGELYPDIKYDELKKATDKFLRRLIQDFSDKQNGKE